MFEPITEDEEARIGLAGAFIETHNDSLFISGTHLCDAEIESKNLDLLLVNGTEVPNAKQLCEGLRVGRCIVACIESLDGNADTVRHVISSMKGKLDSKEMPNNVDIADIRTLMDNADNLYAFDDQARLIDFLTFNAIGDATSILYLAHGDVDLEDYGATNKAISNALPPYAYFQSSVFFKGKQQCSAIVGVRRFVSHKG
ncbi:hypothetical protein [Enterovibrio coralii]|uniref:Uncharacterized protein n=1 Tax=Enterovibrio coralii TaxID=294935 RepID=A0A135I5P2_9GAMM|nr:hypothetical protein [Enterovibrio coralii]KXF80769.1 hypothetical protein ATN88_15925 [Enterovibrio coralii]